MRRPPPHLPCALAALLTTACSALGGGGGGGSNLPNPGAIGWDKPEEAFILRPPETGTTYSEPSPVLLAGGRVALYLGVDDGQTTAVARSVSDDDLAEWSPPVVVAVAGNAPDWADGRIAAPSVVGTDRGYLMAYEAGDGAAIGLATSANGESFTFAAAPLLTAPDDGPIGSPSLLRVEGGFDLYYELRAATGTEVRRAASGPDLTFEPVGTVMGPGTGCTDFDAEPVSCWDASAVRAPDVRLVTTATGRPLYRMFYESAGGDIGYAASWDGAAWQRFPFNPVMDDRAAERAPASIRHDDRYLLFEAEWRTAAVHGIVMATNDHGAPSLAAPRN